MIAVNLYASILRPSWLPLVIRGAHHPYPARWLALWRDQSAQSSILIESDLIGLIMPLWDGVRDCVDVHNRPFSLVFDASMRLRSVIGDFTRPIFFKLDFKMFMYTIF